MKEQIPAPNLPKGWEKAGKIIGITGYGYKNNGYFNTLGITTALKI